MTEAQALLRLQEIDLDMLRMASTLAAMPQQKKMQAIARARRNLLDTEFCGMCSASAISRIFICL